MTATMIEPDTRGIDALSGQLDGNLLGAPLFDELAAEMEQQFADAPWPQVLPEFDDEPWKQLPAIEELEYLWSTRDELLKSIIDSTAVAAFGDAADFDDRFRLQWQLAMVELELKKGDEHGDEQRSEPDNSGSGTDGPVGAADTGGGGITVPGGSENGDQVGEGGEAAVKANSRRASKVSGKRGTRKA